MGFDRLGWCIIGSVGPSSFRFWTIQGIKSQNISATVALVYNIVIGQLYESAVPNLWSIPVVCCLSVDLVYVSVCDLWVCEIPIFGKRTGDIKDIPPAWQSRATEPFVEKVTKKELINWIFIKWKSICAFVTFFYETLNSVSVSECVFVLTFGLKLC